jgi:hypothetical protein
MWTKDKPTPITLEEGERRVQTLIKNQLDEMERLPIWEGLSPDITNTIRHKIIRTAFGAYKVGLITGQRE